MDYLTKFYKNQSEVLAEQVRILEERVQSLYEFNGPPGYSFTPGNKNAPAQSDDDLETRARQIRKTGFFGAKVADEDQSQEYRDIQAELARRRGQGASTPAPAPTPAPSQTPPAREPVEQMGPKGSPSAVPTRTEVQRAQKVADDTGMATALPTNVRPGTMSMTDMDGNPIAVQPKPTSPRPAPTPTVAPDYEKGTMSTWKRKTQVDAAIGMGNMQKYVKDELAARTPARDENEIPYLLQRDPNVPVPGEQTNLPSNIRVPQMTAFPNRYSTPRMPYSEPPSPSVGPRPGSISVVSQPDTSGDGPGRINFSNPVNRPEDVGRVQPASPIEALARSAAFGKLPTNVSGTPEAGNAKPFEPEAYDTEELTTSGRQTGVGQGKTASQPESTWDEVASKYVPAHLKHLPLSRKGGKVYAGNIELSTASDTTSHYADNAPTRAQMNQSKRRKK